MTLEYWISALQQPLTASAFRVFIAELAMADHTAWSVDGPARVAGRSINAVNGLTHAYRDALSRACFANEQLEAARQRELGRLSSGCSELRSIWGRSERPWSRLQASTAPLSLRMNVDGETGLTGLLSRLPNGTSRRRVAQAWSQLRGTPAEELAQVIDELRCHRAKTAEAMHLSAVNRTLQLWLAEALATIEDLFEMLGTSNADDLYLTAQDLLANTRPGAIPTFDPSAAFAAVVVVVRSLGVEMSVERTEDDRLWHAKVRGTDLAGEAIVEFLPPGSGPSNTLACANPIRCEGQWVPAKAWIQCRSSTIHGARRLTFQQLISLAHELGHLVSYSSMRHEVACFNEITDLDPETAEAVPMMVEFAVLDGESSHELAKTLGVDEALFSWMQSAKLVEVLFDRATSLVPAILETSADGVLETYRSLVRRAPRLEVLLPESDALVEFRRGIRDCRPALYAYEFGRTYARAKRGHSNIIHELSDTMRRPPFPDSDPLTSMLRQGVAEWIRRSKWQTTSGFRIRPR